MSENPQLEKLLETDAARCPDMHEDNARLQSLNDELCAVLKMVTDEIRKFHPTFPAYPFVMAERVLRKATS